MIRGIYTSASGMIQGQKRLDVAANNLANVTTPGFKEKTPVSKAYPNKEIYRTGDNKQELPMGTIDRPEHIGSMNTGVASDGTYTDFSQKSTRKTQNPLDFAIEGEGFFNVERGNGDRAYTRNGSFRINSEQELVTSGGHRVLGEDGPISVPENTTEISSTSDGTIVDSDNQVLGRLQITQFENLQKLRNLGENFYRQGPNNPIVDQGDMQPYTVRQGELEQSNTKAIKHVVKMIEINRLYSMEGSLLKKQSKSLGQALKTVAKA